MGTFIFYASLWITLLFILALNIKPRYSFNTYSPYSTTRSHSRNFQSSHGFYLPYKGNLSGSIPPKYLPSIPHFATAATVPTTVIEMPSLSSTMKEGKIVSWKKQIGDKIEYGDTLMIVESDKADMEVESFNEGYLAKHLVAEGESAAVGQAVCLLVDKSSEIDLANTQLTVQSSIPNSLPPVVPQKENILPNEIPQISATPVYMPSLSSTMSEGKIVKWLKQKGDKIELGDSIMIVESDKADMEVEAFEEGYLATILTQEGEYAAVNKEVAFLVPEKGDIAAYEKYSTQKASSAINPLIPSPPSSSESSPSTPPPSTPSPSTAQPSTSPTTSIVPQSFSAVTNYKGWLQDFTPNSIDQTIYEQIPSKDENDLGEIFMQRVQNQEMGSNLLNNFKQSSKGNESIALMKMRASNRIPPPNNIFANDIARDGSLWKVSGAARAAMKKYGLSEEQVKGSGMGGRIFLEDVERAHEDIKFGDSQQTQPVIVSVTPSASKLAKSKGIDPLTISGTGPYNRVTLEDVQHHLGITPENPINSEPPKVKTVKPSIIEPLTGMKKAISKNMEATLNTPVFRVTSAISTDNLDSIYRQLKSKGISLSSLITKAVANTLSKHPIMNAAYSSQNGGSIVYPNKINIANAVALEDGLITPVIKDADLKDIQTISSEWKELINKAKSKKLAIEEYTGATFVISNLGMYGVTQFDAILPSDVGTIMAVSASLPKLTQNQNDEISTHYEMQVTVTCDHRHIYGSHAAEFLKDLKYLIEEEPMTLLIN